jgi:hypothetical protein
MEGFFRLVAEHHGKDHGGQRVFQLVEDEADSAEYQHEPKIRGGIRNRIGADKADRHDHRTDDRERDAQQRREQRDR